MAFVSIGLGQTPVYTLGINAQRAIPTASFDVRRSVAQPSLQQRAAQVVSFMEPAQVWDHPRYGKINLPAGWNFDPSLPTACRNIRGNAFGQGFCGAMASERLVSEDVRTRVGAKEAAEQLEAAVRLYASNPDALYQYATTHHAFFWDSPNKTVYSAPQPRTSSGNDIVWKAALPSVAPNAYVTYENTRWYSSEGTQLTFYGVPCNGVGLAYYPDIYAFARLGISNLLQEEPQGDAQKIDWARRVKRYFECWVVALPISLPSTTASPLTGFGSWHFISPADFIPVMRWNQADIGPLNFDQVNVFREDTPVSKVIGTNYYGNRTYGRFGSKTLVAADIDVPIVKGFLLQLLLLEADQALSIIVANYNTWWSQMFPAWAEGLPPDQVRAYQALASQAQATDVVTQGLRSSDALKATLAVAQFLPIPGLDRIISGLLELSAELLKGWVSTPPAYPPPLLRRIVDTASCIEGTWSDGRFYPKVAISESGAAAASNITYGLDLKKLAASGSRTVSQASVIEASQSGPGIAPIIAEKLSTRSATGLPAKSSSTGLVVLGALAVGGLVATLLMRRR